MTTSFTRILQRTLAHTPRAVGVVFADWDGEAVDHVGELARDDLLVLAAHYGIILSQVQAALRLFHFGEAEELTIHHERMDMVVRSVREGYFVILLTRGAVHLGSARRELDAAAQALREEMG